jgi:hypothetical protein
MITQFLIETDSGRPGVHTKLFVTKVARNILCEDHQGPSDTLTLHIIGDRHLPEPECAGVHPGHNTATQDPVIFKGAHEDVFFLLLQLFLVEPKSEGFAQDVIAQLHHLLVFLCTVIDHPKRHTVIDLPAGDRRCGGPVGQEAEVIQKPLKCGLLWVWLGQTLIFKIKNALFVWFSPILIHLQPYN